jgi:RNA polymerase sigma factor (sigma-70 family)
MPVQTSHEHHYSPGSAELRATDPGQAPPDPHCYAEFHRAIALVCDYRFGRGSADSQGAVQDCWEQVLAANGTFPQPGKAFSWAWTIAQRVCTRRQVKLARELSLLGNEDPDTISASDSAVAAERECKLEAIAHAVLNLPEPFRTAVIARHYLGLSYNEIAARTGTALGTAKSRVNAGKKRLVNLRESGILPLMATKCLSRRQGDGDDCRHCGEFTNLVEWLRKKLTDSGE